MPFCMLLHATQRACQCCQNCKQARLGRKRSLEQEGVSHACQTRLGLQLDLSPDVHVIYALDEAVQFVAAALS